MASHGSVVAEWTTAGGEGEKCGGTVSRAEGCPASSSPPKPEVPRKPPVPGSRPCPPIPKKPPVAHKNPLNLLDSSPSPSLSPSLLAEASSAAQHHDSSAAGCLPVPSSSLPSPQADTPTPATLSPSAAQPEASSGQEAQSSCTTCHPLPIPTVSKAENKASPPPLPINPPKGDPASHKRTGKDPPPRPSPLSIAKKTPPPVPAKKPANRRCVAACDTDRESSHLDQVSLALSDPSQKNSSTPHVDAAETDVRQSESCVLPSCESEITLMPNVHSYAQVVVEENLCRFTKVSAKENPQRNLIPQHAQPRSYENVELKQKSHNLPSVDLSHSYEQVVVEENAGFSAGASAVCKPEHADNELNESEDVSESLDGHKRLSHAGDLVQSLVFSEPKESTETCSTEDHAGPDKKVTAKVNKSDDIASVDSVKEFLSLSNKQQSAYNNSEDKLVLNKEEPEDVVRQFPKRPARPSVPPPVRPKPRKRVAVLRHSQVEDEESALELLCSAVVTDFPPAQQDCTESPKTDSYLIEEAVYQEIDDFKPPATSLSKSKGSGNSSADTAPHIDVINSDPLVEDVVSCSTSGSDLRTESCPNTDTDKVSSVERGSVQNACLEDSAFVVEASDITKAPADTEGIFSQTSQETEVGSYSTAKDGETSDLKNIAEDSRKSPSPEKHEPLSLEDVGETSFMLREIEQLLKVQLESVSSETKAASSEVSKILTSSQSLDTPLRPPRPKRDKLRKLSIGCSSADSSSTESLSSVGLPGKKAPPKPKRKNLPGSVNRSLSDVTGMKIYVDQLNNQEEEEEKPFLPPRQQSLRLNIGPAPPPLPPRNKSMERVLAEEGSRQAGLERKVKEEEQSSTAERRASAPNFVTATPVSRNSSVGKSSKRNMPRPTRKAPPPPPQPPNHAASPFVVQSGAITGDISGSSGDKVPGYQKISNGLAVAGDDINAVVPNIGMVGKIDSPNGPDVLADNDYHEIPDALVLELIEKTEETPADSSSKEGTPQPVLPPRGYRSPSQVPTITTSDIDLPCITADDSKPSDLKSSYNDANPKTEASSAEEPSLLDGVASEEAGGIGSLNRLSGHLSTEDSASQSSQRSSCPESFSSEVLGSLAHIVGSHHQRPASTHSSSSHSETGSAVEVPTFDHSSGSESENEDDEERMRQKREKKVYYIAEEVVKSEKVFVDVLKLLNVDFRVFMSSKTEQAGHAIVPTETLNKILDFLPQLQSFNEMLLKDLTERIANWDKQKKIADVFVKKGPFLKLYSSYIRNFEHATALLDETCKKHHGFGMALQQFEFSQRCASLALKHYMLKPIQRIPQYKLLLQDYLKHLTPDSPDYKDTITALSIVSEVADHANESMRHGDNVQKLLEIQRSLIGQFEVIQPGRVLIKKGELMKMSRKEMQPRMFFLFSDVLLYTTPTATGYRLNNILPLQGMKVLPPKLEEFHNEFNIITTHRSFTVATNTQEEREEWLRKLWNAIEENSERYHTFKAMQPEPKTSLLDKDFVLGTKAPLWVPDARVTMCMLCLAEFSITWRRHHCRACGRIICGYCSENKAPLRYLVYKPARVCDECFEKLAKEVEEGLEKEKKLPGDKAASLPLSSTSTTTGGGTSSSSSIVVAASPVSVSSSESSGLSFSSLKAHFQKIRKSGREKRSFGRARPSVLKEVHANDEGSDMSGYLWVAKNKKWKRLWFVVKGKVLYTYKASEDMAAIESMPLLGFEVTRMTSWYQGAEPDLMFELHHQNTQPLVFKPRNPNISTGGDRSSIVSSDESQALSSPSLSPHVKSSVDTTTPRLIFRTDSAAATTKWLNVLREASLA